MKDLIKSILTDVKSWNRILVNRWHLHAPIALIAGCFMFWLLKDTISDTYVSTEIAFKIFIPSFLGGICLWLFEAWQKRGRIIGELEMFESNKDFIVGLFFLLCGILTTFFYFYV
jgi:hypothetical protein